MQLRSMSDIFNYNI